MIVIVTQCFPPVTGGMESLMGGLADALAGAGKAVTVLADSKRREDEKDSDTARPYSILRFAGPRPWRRWRKRRRLRQLLHSTPVEAVFTDSWKSAATALPALNRSDVALISLAHGNDILSQGDPRRAGRIRSILSQVTGIAANSQYTARLVQDLGIDPERISVVHPGFTPPPPPDAPSREQVEQWCKPFRPVLLTVSRLEPRKGHDQVIRCLPALRRTFPDIGYLIAGSGPDRARLETLAEEQGVSQHICFTGRVSETLKSALLEQADLLVMPVREDQACHSVEGFGIAYLEAANTGLPVIGGNSGGVADAVADGETGVLCDGNDTEAVCRAIHETLSRPEIDREMRKAAKTRADDFTWQTAVNRYLDLLTPEHPR